MAAMTDADELSRAWWRAIENHDLDFIREHFADVVDREQMLAYASGAMWDTDDRAIKCLMEDCGMARWPGVTSVMLSLAASEANADRVRWVLGLGVDNLYDLTETERIKRGINSLPSSLKEALDATQESEFVREALGESLVENFLELKYAEWDDFRLQVSPWEMDRYFRTL